jgi:hypothetical protein
MFILVLFPTQESFCPLIPSAFIRIFHQMKLDQYQNIFMSFVVLNSVAIEEIELVKLQYFMLFYQFYEYFKFYFLEF